LDKYPKSKQGGLWKNNKSDETNKQPPYRGHLVVTKEMLKTLVVLMQNGAWDQAGQSPDLGPRINLAAWLNTAKESGEKYFGVQGDVYYPEKYNSLFDGSAEPEAPAESRPVVAAPPIDDDFPF
tara:strand:+ start:424 stop:795 length:372 start_codon:yes stop_codon:yes gene_type:complete